MPSRKLPVVNQSESNLAKRNKALLDRLINIKPVESFQMLKAPPQMSLVMMKQELMKCNQIERENQTLIDNLRSAYNMSDQHRSRLNN